jgi:hypothetical protein
MEPISFLIVGFATLGASAAKDIIASLWEKYVIPRLDKKEKKVVITTKAGKRITIDGSANLSDIKVAEIVSQIGGQPKADPEKEEPR